MTDLSTSILIDMTQGFTIAETNIMRDKADKVVDVMDMDFPIEACQCDSTRTCVKSDAVLGQSDPLKLCLRFEEGEDNELPPVFVQMFDLKTFSCTQDASTFTPIFNYERLGEKELTAVEIIKGGTGVDSRILSVHVMLPTSFYGSEQRPVDCTGTVLLSFESGYPNDSTDSTDSSDDDNDDNDDMFRGRFLRETFVSFRSAESNFDRRATETLNESESDFAVEVMLAKASESDGPGVGLISGAIVGSVLMAGTIGVAIIAKIRPAAIARQKRSKAQLSITEASSSISSSNMDVGFQLEHGMCA